MNYYLIYIGFAFGAVAVALFLSAKSKYKWPKEKGKKRQWMTNGEYLLNRFRAWRYGNWKSKMYKGLKGAK